MPTIASILDLKFRQAIRQAFDLDADPLVGPAQNDKFGDYQANAAMSLAKTVAEKTGQKSNPRQVAETIKAALDLGDIASDLSIAGPGFINVKLKPEWLAAQLQAISGDDRLGVEPAPTPQTVVVDYSGPNIAKQMHVGHLRSTIIGDAVARLLQFQGHRVIRQNHVGDWGTQFGRVVLAIWYEAVFQLTDNRATLATLIERQQSAARAFADHRERDEKGANAAYAAEIAAIVRELAPWHQRLLDEDPDGTRYFVPYLRDSLLNLDELERAYVFVSVVTDSKEAEQVAIKHYVHGEHTLANVPRLTTTFIQNLTKSPRNEQELLAWQKARDVTLTACADLYRRLGVQLGDPSVQGEPLERGESFYNDMLAGVVAELRAKGLAIESEGAMVVPVPGYESPLIIEKSPTRDANGNMVPGGYLYGTTDLAAIRYRVGTLGARRALYFTDARQSQHFAQVFAVAKLAGWTEGASLEHAPFGTMLGEDGKPFKTRSGDVVRLSALLDEAEERARTVVDEKNAELPAEQRAQIAKAVGIGAVKYADLSKDRTSDYMFSFDKMLDLKGNTAPYLQYAHARTRSVFRKADELGIDVLAAVGAPITLQAPEEIALAKHLLRFGDVVDLVARELKPHHLTTYLYELATRFSSFWENCPVLQSEDPLRSSRLALVNLVAAALAKGLDLLGIEHPEQM